MHQIAKKGLITALATGSSLFAGVGMAHADSGAEGTAAGSPGVLSGNHVQAPVHAPVNVCGNTVNVIGLLNPTTGNKCANPGKGNPPHKPPGHQPPAEQPPGHQPPGDQPPSHQPPHQPPGDQPPAEQPPADEPPAHEPPTTGQPPADEPPAQEPPSVLPPEQAPPAHQPSTRVNLPETPKAPEAPTAELAKTGSEVSPGAVLPIAGAALLGGGMLYRRFRTARQEG